MQCPKCGSEQTQRLEMVFSGGTQDVTSTSKTAGVGSLSGMLGMSGHMTKTSGVSQSVLAQQASPPIKRPLKWPVILLVVGLMCLSGGGMVTMIGLAMIAGGGVWGYTSFEYNRTVWPQLCQTWMESWLCHKCGNVYQQA